MALLDLKQPAPYVTTGSSFVTIPNSTMRLRAGNTGAMSIMFTNISTAQTAIVQVIASDEDPGPGNDLDTSNQMCVVLDSTHVSGGGSSVTLAKSNVPQAYTEDHPHFLFYAVQAKDGDGHGTVKTILAART